MCGVHYNQSVVWLLPHLVRISDSGQSVVLAWWLWLTDMQSRYVWGWFSHTQTRTRTHTHTLSLAHTHGRCEKRQSVLNMTTCGEQNSSVITSASPRDTEPHFYIWSSKVCVGFKLFVSLLCKHAIQPTRPGSNTFLCSSRLAWWNCADQEDKKAGFALQ